MGRWRDPRVIGAWLLFLAAAGGVLWLGSGDFGAATTSRFLRPLIQFFLPNLTARELAALHVATRKLAHVVEYAVLAALAFRALRLSLDTLPGRLAAGAIALALAVASIDELRQASLAQRTGSPRDVLIDGLGALLAVALLVLLRRRRVAAEALS